MGQSREQFLATICAAVLVFAAFFWAYSGSSNRSQFEQQTPRIEVSQQATQSTEQEHGSEYWPWLILGLHLKVTDSLLAVITLLPCCCWLVAGLPPQSNSRCH